MTRFLTLIKNSVFKKSDFLLQGDVAVVGPGHNLMNDQYRCLLLAMIEVAGDDSAPWTETTTKPDRESTLSSVWTRTLILFGPVNSWSK